MKLPSAFKKIWDIFTTAFVTIVVIFAVFLVCTRLMGFRVFNVISGSMEPAYSVGDLLFVKEADPDTIRETDVITFVLNDELVVATHRVVKVDAENCHFYTKGDANETADAAPVHFNNVIGIPVFCVPWLGYVADYIGHPPGTYVAAVVLVLLVLVVFLPDLLKNLSAKKEEIS